MKCGVARQKQFVKKDSLRVRVVNARVHIDFSLLCK